MFPYIGAQRVYDLDKDAIHSLDKKLLNNGRPVGKRTGAGRPAAKEVQEPQEGP